MEKLTNDEFFKFIKSFEGGTYEEVKGGNTTIHKFYDSITELSRSETIEADALIEHPFEMYALDWICKDCNSMKGNLPSTTDAIFFKPDGKKPALYIIEFKFISSRSFKTKLDYVWDEVIEMNSKRHFPKRFLDDLKDIKEDFKDKIEFSLRLKPFETIFIVLPELYSVYCKEKGFTKKDIRLFLDEIDIEYWVFLGNKSQNESNVKLMANRLKKPYIRLERCIVKTAQVKPKSYFDTFMDVEIYEDLSILKKELI